MPVLMISGLRKGRALCLAMGLAGATWTGATTLTVDSPTERRILQRQPGGERGMADIDASGACPGGTGTLELRAVGESGTEVVPWRAVSGCSDAGQWSGVLSAVPAGGLRCSVLTYSRVASLGMWELGLPPSYQSLAAM